jgi:hypothetical protein
MLSSLKIHQVGGCQSAGQQTRRGIKSMYSAEEQQMLSILSEISQDIKALLVLTRDSTRKQGEADEKANGQLVNIAHKR